MPEPHIFYLRGKQVIDCGPSEDSISNWHVDWNEHHYFFARPVLLPL